jgi:REP element-mobilizing transposase RayT
MRLADALPRTVMAAWHDDVERRMHMLSEMKGRPLDPSEERTLVQRTLGRVERYLDSGHGSCVLTDERAAGLVESVLWGGDGDRYRLHAWSVMPNHVHALVTPLGPREISDVLQEWKTESTRRVNQELRRAGSLWHPDVIDHEVDHPAEFARMRAMIAANPEQTGLHDWPFAGEETRSSTLPLATA